MRQYNNRARTTKSQQLRNKAGQFSTAQKEFAARDVAFEDYKKQMGAQYKNLQDTYAKQGQQFQTELNRLSKAQKPIEPTPAQKQQQKKQQLGNKIGKIATSVSNVSSFIKGIMG